MIGIIGDRMNPPNNKFDLDFDYFSNYCVHKMSKYSKNSNDLLILL